MQRVRSEPSWTLRLLVSNQKWERFAESITISPSPGEEEESSAFFKWLYANNVVIYLIGTNFSSQRDSTTNEITVINQSAKIPFLFIISTLNPARSDLERAVSDLLILGQKSSSSLQRALLCYTFTIKCVGV